MSAPAMKIPPAKATAMKTMPMKIVSESEGK
jgi:hypothetical protein